MVCGSIMNHHGNGGSEIGQRDQQFPGRYIDWRPNLPHGMSTAVFVGSRTVDSLLPPALVVEKQKQAEPLGTGGDTHKHAVNVM